MSHPVGIGHNRPPEGSILASQFLRHFADAERGIPRRHRLAILRAARARFVERFAAGRADEPLYFDDLVEAVEAALVGRSHVILRGTAP